jgi:hypothetical protein
MPYFRIVPIAESPTDPAVSAARVSPSRADALQRQDTMLDELVGRAAGYGSSGIVSGASRSSQVSRRRATAATPPETTISGGRGWVL